MNLILLVKTENYQDFPEILLQLSKDLSKNIKIMKGESNCLGIDCVLSNAQDYQFDYQIENSNNSSLYEYLNGRQV